MLKQHEQALYLFAVAMRNAVSRPQFAIEDLDTAQADVLGEERSVSIRNGMLEDDFAGYGVLLLQASAVWTLTLYHRWLAIRQTAHWQPSPRFFLPGFGSAAEAQNFPCVRDQIGKRKANGAFGYGQVRMLKMAKRMIRDGVSLTIALPLSRRLLNSVYVRLTPAQRAQFYLRLAKIFRNNRIRGRR